MITVELGEMEIGYRYAGHDGACDSA